jgi:hypothetical protein
MVRGLMLSVCWGLLLSACRLHSLEDGHFALTIDQVLRDDCGLATTARAASGAVLRTMGNTVSMDYGFLETRLVGTYLSAVEEMTLDGTAVNVITTVRGRECQVDTVSTHLKAATVDASSFAGVIKIGLEASTPDECTCQLWFTYQAQRLGP